MLITPMQAQKVFDEADCLFTAAEVDKAIDRVAGEINRELHDKNPLVLCVMTGGIVPVSFESGLHTCHPLCW
jgi:hypoxanthine phosphoribosyltransferase